MSAEGPSNPIGDRPRMAEALASLKEGLRDTADPLYDGWKRRPRPLPAQPPRPSLDREKQGDGNGEGALVPHPPRAVAASPASRADTAQPDAGETIDISLEGTSDAIPLSTTESPTLGGDEGVEVSFPDASDGRGDTLPTEEQLIEVLYQEPRPAILLRPSVQTDTVRVRVIRYQPFPRWALIVAAALVVFAGSALLLRASFPRQGARATRSVLANGTAVPGAATTAERGRFVASGSAEPSARGAVDPAAPLGVRTSPPAEAAPPAAAEPAPSVERSLSISPPSEAASAPPPTVKTPAPSPKRRAGGRDFFRDPGF